MLGETNRLSREVTTKENLAPCLTVLEIAKAHVGMMTRSKSVVSEPEIRRSDQCSASPVCDFELFTGMSPLNPEATPFVSNDDELTPAVGGDIRRTHVSDSCLPSPRNTFRLSRHLMIAFRLSMPIVEEETSQHLCVPGVHVIMKRPASICVYHEFM